MLPDRLQKRREKAAVKRFFKRVLRPCSVPRKIVADQLRGYSAGSCRSLDEASER
jgi:putative transposase